MAKTPKVVLTGASGWYGNSFIYSFVNKFGYKNIHNLLLLTSDGRNIYHKLLNHSFTTFSLNKFEDNFKSFEKFKDSDLFVQAAFLTRDKINKYGKKKYENINYQIIEDTERLFNYINPLTRVLISSGAVEDNNDLYGRIKCFEENSVIGSKCSSKIIFRVYGAMGINTPLSDWSAIADLISSSNKLDSVNLKSTKNIVRGYVSFEKLSELIIKMSIFKLEKLNLTIPAIEHVSSLHEIAKMISQIGKSKFIHKGINLEEMPDIYTADSTKFLNILDRYDIDRTSLIEDITKTMQSPHLQ